MADNIVGKKIKELVETTSVNNTDDFLLEDTTPKTKRIKWSSLLTAITNAIAKDSGWITLPLAAGISAANGAAQYRKIGKMVYVRAIVKAATDLGGSYDEVTLATLPAGYRPSQMIAELQHAYNHHIYQVRINANGTITASRARSTYSTGGFLDVAAGGNFYIHTTFMID